MAIYQGGNAFQNQMYRHMAKRYSQGGYREWGKTSSETPYPHLLTERDARLNFLSEEIYQAVIERFDRHKAGDLQRVLTNTVASQTACFNLFVPLAQDLALASCCFSRLLGKQVSVQHVEIEFTPNTCRDIAGFEWQEEESLGDQEGPKGTDADVAVFYRDQAGQRGVLLIEFKLLEAAFSCCSSYREKALVRILCDEGQFFKLLVKERLADATGVPLCGYRRYFNWEIAEQGESFDDYAIRSAPGCPFRFSGQQLWRNYLLAEQVKRSRRLDEYGFWVIAPADNQDLWHNHGEDVAAVFRSALTPQGRQRFSTLTLEEFCHSLADEVVSGSNAEKWLRAYRERYISIDKE